MPNFPRFSGIVGNSTSPSEAIPAPQPGNTAAPVGQNGNQHAEEAIRTGKLTLPRQVLDGTPQMRKDYVKRKMDSDRERYLQNSLGQGKSQYITNSLDAMKRNGQISDGASAFRKAEQAWQEAASAHLEKWNTELADVSLAMAEQEWNRRVIHLTSATPPTAGKTGHTLAPAPPPSQQRIALSADQNDARQKYAVSIMTQACVRHVLRCTGKNYTQFIESHLEKLPHHASEQRRALARKSAEQA